MRALVYKWRFVFMQMRPQVLRFSRYLALVKSLTRRFGRKYDSDELLHLRNIGILAHIDAGKTTTTERMLFYSGKINFMGEVHDGNTVTDYMAQERERGITIASAAVSFPWKNHQFNLIDTPGHIDFTMEVEQSLQVLDGAIVIFDGSAGVEAQTVTVWNQADIYKIPRIVYVNKMDRKDSDFQMCCNHVESKLETAALPVQLPVKDSDGKLISILDVLTLENLTWNQTNEGKCVQRVPLTKDVPLWEIGSEARVKLIDKLSDFDNNLSEVLLKVESFESISSVLIAESIKKVVNEQKGVPILCGSSYKNIGVQPLMDAVIAYLPHPGEKINYLQCFGDNFCAKAFKVKHDDQRGALVYFRILNGSLKKGQKVYNIQLDKSEQISRLLVPHADEEEEVDEVTNGNIAVAVGLKKTVIGHAITTSQSEARKIKKNAEKLFEKRKINEDNFKKIEKLFNPEIRIPEPVFFCSIEPPSQSYQTQLEVALSQLSREDPSLRVTSNIETGQTVLSGMGELHLEVIRDRIIKEYQIEVELGPLQIAYKEEAAKMHRLSHELSKTIGDSRQYVSLLMSVVPVDSTKKHDVLVLDKHPDFASKLTKIHPRTLLAINLGVESALNCGPKLGCPVINTYVTLHDFEIGRGTSEPVISATASQCIRKILNDSGTYILEPLMKLQIICGQSYLSIILADLSRRRATIEQISERKNHKVIDSLTPLSELLGYSTRLRSLTSGTGNFHMEFHSYQKMSVLEETNAIHRVTGF